MNNVLLKQRMGYLWHLPVGLVWAWQAESFSLQQIALSPLSLILPIVLLGLVRTFFRKDVTGVSILKHIFSALGAFAIASASASISLFLSPIWKSFFRLLMIPDFLTTNILNYRSIFFGDLWVQFFIFGAAFSAILGALDKEFSLKTTLFSGLWFSLAAFFAPLLGNLIYFLFNDERAGIIITFVALALFGAKASDTRRQLTIYEA